MTRRALPVLQPCGAPGYTALLEAVRFALDAIQADPDLYRVAHPKGELWDRLVWAEALATGQPRDEVAAARRGLKSQQPRRLLSYREWCARRAQETAGEGVIGNGQGGGHWPGKGRGG